MLNTNQVLYEADTTTTSRSLTFMHKLRGRTGARHASSFVEVVLYAWKIVKYKR
jgi:hypothetical protein